MMFELKKIKFPKVEFHPLFVGYLAYLFFCGREISVIISIVIVLLHETGHYIVGSLIGRQYSGIVLYPYGAVIKEEEHTVEDKEWIVALAGPILNFVCAFVGVVFLKLNNSSAWLIEFINGNLTIGLFNLLPVYPLDGARVILSVSKNYVRMMRYLRIGGIAISSALIGLFFYTLSKEINLSFLILGIFLFLGSLQGVEKEISARVAKTLFIRSKDYKNGVPIQCIAFDVETPVYKVVNKLSQTKISDVELVSEGKRVKRLKEEEILKFAMKSDANAKIEEIIKNN